MKNWNRTGKIKAIILLIIAIPNLLVPVHSNHLPNFFIFMFFISAMFMTMFIAKLNRALYEMDTVKPIWNDNPLNLSKSLNLIHFGVYFFITLGLSMIIGAAIKYQSLNYFGLMNVSCGLGMLLGIQLTLKLNRK